MCKITKARSHKLQTSAYRHSLLRTKVHSQCSFQPEGNNLKTFENNCCNKSSHCKESALLARRRHSTEPEKISPHYWLAKKGLSGSRNSSPTEIASTANKIFSYFTNWWTWVCLHQSLGHPRLCRPKNKPHGSYFYLPSGQAKISEEKISSLELSKVTNTSILHGYLLCYISFIQH